MSGPAQVRSTAALEAFHAALVRFQQRVQNALDSLDGELHRADDWIEHDRPGHWRKQVHEAEDQVHEAKLDLERCLLNIVVEGQRPACREQKAALEQARARLEYCRDKAEKVKHWQRSFRHEMFEYDGRIGQLRGLVEQELPAARAALGKIMRRLEEYGVEKPPETFLAQEAAPTVAAPPLSVAPPADAPSAPQESSSP